MQTFEYSETGFAMTKTFEGLSLTTYKDVAGNETIGYGHLLTPGESYPNGITEAEADMLLRGDMAEAVACVNKAVTATITQGQFDALVDFVYNVGRGDFLGSTLLRMVNASAFTSAATQFARWVHAGGEVEPGLVRRRKAEAAMFAGGAA